MVTCFRNRHFLKLLDFTPEEISDLLLLSTDLKNARRAGNEQQRLKGKNIALIFEKTSTRTRCAFEVAAYDQGAHVTYLGPEGSQIGHKESMKDTARVLGRMYDGIEYRGFAQETVEILGKYARAKSHGQALSVDQKTTEVNFNYIIKQFNARVMSFYQDTRYSKQAPNTWRLGVGLQIQM